MDSGEHLRGAIVADSNQRTTVCIKLEKRQPCGADISAAQG